MLNFFITVLHRFCAQLRVRKTVNEPNPQYLEARLVRMWPPASSRNTTPAPRLQAFDNNFEGYDP